MASTSRFQLATKYEGLETSVWTEFIALALKEKPCNLGQGFPDYPPPNYVTESLKDVMSDSTLFNQYTRGFGHPRLVNAIAALYSKLIERELDPITNVLVTAGAYEALFCTIMGNCNPGEEVIVIEPAFDCYEAMVQMAGGVAKLIPLRCSKTSGKVSSADWKLDTAELESKFNKNTKMIILNTPHNPVGKVFTYDELTVIADLCKKYDVLCVADEVYEHLVYAPNKHVRIATLPGMWERTVTIGSAGKTFSVTGWKCGWAYAPDFILKNLRTIHQNCVYTCPTPIQEAVARGFELEAGRLGTPECYFNSISEECRSKRDYMATFLENVGMVPTVPEGGYFMMADWTPLGEKLNYTGEDKRKDYRFVKWLCRNYKLQGIPPSAFYSEVDKHLGEDYIRMCFFKKDETLKTAETILTDLKKSL